MNQSSTGTAPRPVPAVNVDPAWQDHPIVARCLERHPDSTTDALAELSTVLGNLEAKFPGQTFEDVLRDPPPSLNEPDLYSPMRMEMYELADTGLRCSELHRAHPDVNYSRLRHAVALRRPLTEEQRFLVELFDEYGFPEALLHDPKRRPPSGYVPALMRRHYHQTRRLHDYSEAPERGA